MATGDLKFRVERKKTSYNFKKDMTSPDSWDGDHNAQHNMEDRITLEYQGRVIWEAYGQTVANMPGTRHSNTIRPGFFWVRWDVEHRAFKGKIHGIVRAFDFDGQLIDDNSVEPTVGKDGAPADFARWIFGHSTRKNVPAPDGELTRHAWSAGCCIVSPEAQDSLYDLGTKAGLVAGDLIPCDLVEV